MTLPSSGPISLDQMNVEAFGTSGSRCTINDKGIRCLAGKSSGQTMSFSEWRGKTVPVGGSATITQETLLEYASYSVGYYKNKRFGSISPSPFELSCRFEVTGLYRLQTSNLDQAGEYWEMLYLYIGGDIRDKPVWSFLDVRLNGTTYTFSRDSGINYSGAEYSRYQWYERNGYFMPGSRQRSDLIAEFPINGTGKTTSFTLR